VTQPTPTPVPGFTRALPQVTVVLCPGCRARYEIDRGKLRALLLPLACARCQTIFHPENEAPAPPERRNRPRPLVVLGHESAALIESVRGLLAEDGLDLAPAYDGQTVLALIERELPDALVLDVGLPGVAAYQVVDLVRQRGLPLPIVLIASVYSRTSYKRRPRALYGADDYVEQHHLTDLLGPKLKRLLTPGGSATPVPEPGAMSATRRARDQLISAVGRSRLDVLPGGTEPGGSEPAPSGDEALMRGRRLAWLIVTDIALYNEETLGAGLTPSAVRLRLAADLDEGRRLLAERVPAAVLEGHDLIGEALDQLLAQRAGRPPVPPAEGGS
jgi:CheY-like chemotaxis protein